MHSERHLGTLSSRVGFGEHWSALCRVYVCTHLYPRTIGPFQHKLMSSREERIIIDVAVIHRSLSDDLTSALDIGTPLFHKELQRDHGKQQGNYSSGNAPRCYIASFWWCLPRAGSWYNLGVVGAHQETCQIAAQ